MAHRLSNCWRFGAIITRARSRSTRVDKPENDDPSIVEPIELSAAWLERKAICGCDGLPTEDTGLALAQCVRASAAGRLIVGGLFPGLNSLTTISDVQSSETLKWLTGFGPRSAEYVLVRGMARPHRDAVRRSWSSLR